jgi:para-nitrobenzyl esterase
VSEYRQYLEKDSGVFADQEFSAWPALSDAEVPPQYLKLQDEAFAYGSWSMAKSMSRIHEPAFLYLFTWRQSGKSSELGAYHGEELAFLDDSFPNSWGFSNSDKAFGNLLRNYWVQFAKTGNPNSAGLPEWPACNARADQVLELGQTVRMRPINPNLLTLEHIMLQVQAAHVGARSEAE